MPDVLTPPAPAATPPVAPATPAPAAVAPPAPVTPAAAAPAPATAPAAEPPKGQSLLEGAGSPNPGDASGKQGAPETYADFTLPEGISADPKLLDAFKGVAKKHNLSQEAAQELVTLQAQTQKASGEFIVKEAERLRTEQQQKWQAEVKKNLGPNWQKEMSFAGKALDAFGGPELRKRATEMGWGDDPLFVNAWVAVGKAMGEAQPGSGTRVDVSDPKETTKRSMFPRMFDGSNGLGSQK